MYLFGDVWQRRRLFTVEVLSEEHRREGEGRVVAMETLVKSSVPLCAFVGIEKLEILSRVRGFFRQ